MIEISLLKYELVVEILCLCWKKIWNDSIKSFLYMRTFAPYRFSLVARARSVVLQVVWPRRVPAPPQGPLRPLTSPRAESLSSPPSFEASASSSLTTCKNTGSPSQTMTNDNGIALKTTSPIWFNNFVYNHRFIKVYNRYL